jgi:SRSO17 transposase
MSRRPANPAPAPLEAYCQQVDECFRTVNQRTAFRRYLEGLLLPSERNKTLTALANAEPISGAQQAGVQRLQWFLSESSWQPAVLNRRRLELLQADPILAPHAAGVLVLDEHGDRKWGTQTAHLGRQYLANLGKVELGVVSVSSLWADERRYYPIDVEPYTPAHHFAGGKSDPAFRTKPQIALALVRRAVAQGLSFRAVVADSFYGEDAGFAQGLRDLGVGAVLALKPSHSWWHPPEAVGALWEAAEQAGWQEATHPGAWQRVERRFSDGHGEIWWALEVEAGPYGPAKPQRAVVVTTEPATLPDRTTWYLATTLPAPDTERAAEMTLPAADLAEIVRLYGLRMWIEQSYKQVKHSLGWSQYQVRADLAIRRHWTLVCCAFSFCWHAADRLDVGSPPETVHLNEAASPAEDVSAGRGENPAPDDLAGGLAPGARLAGTGHLARTLVAGLVRHAPATGAPGAAHRTRAGYPPRLL